MTQYSAFIDVWDDQFLSYTNVIRVTAAVKQRTKAQFIQKWSIEIYSSSRIYVDKLFKSNF